MTLRDHTRLLHQKNLEDRAIAWAVLMAASGAIKLTDANGKDPAWEHTLPQTESARADYAKLLQGIIEKDEVLKTQVLEMFDNPQVRDQATKNYLDVQMSHAEKVSRQALDRIQNPRRKI